MYMSWGSNINLGTSSIKITVTFQGSNMFYFGSTGFKEVTLTLVIYALWKQH